MSLSSLFPDVQPGFGFLEVMDGTYRGVGDFSHQGWFGLSFQVECCDLSHPIRSIIGRMQGRVTMEGVADDVASTGIMEISPFSKRTLRFQFSFRGNDGKAYSFDGLKHIRWRRPLHSWTVLPAGEVFDDATGEPVALVSVRFHLRRDLFKLLRSFRRAVSPDSHRLWRRSSERKRALSFAQAVVPNGRIFNGANERSVASAEAFMGDLSDSLGRGFSALLKMLDRASVLWTLRTFKGLSAERQEALLRRWERSRVFQWPLFAVSFPFKTTHFDDPDVYEAFDCSYDKGGKPEKARWKSQVTSGRSVKHDETVECDAVVVGTGAGGAVVGRELAAKGHAVVFLEEGELHQRDEFTGSVVDAHRKFYRSRGAIVPIGNTVMPIFMGRMVGGSTAINGGTCYRTPEWVLDKWCEDLSSDELSPQKLKRHFEAVEAQLGVEPAKDEVLGGLARIIERGCDTLGWRHSVINRNAPDCDGQCVCLFGCPTDARRSTNISFVPDALDHAAVLYTGMRANRLLLENGNATGVEARAVKGAGTLRVRARAVIFSGGAISTPLFLLGQGLFDNHTPVGRNLSLHPIATVSGLFDERICGFNSVPQGYGCDQFHRQGILLLGASAPINIGATLFAFNGRRLMETMEAYDRIASLFAMTIEDARGRVRRRKNGKMFITHRLTKQDVARLHQGMTHIAEMLFAAGARRVFPLLPRAPILDGESELDSFRRLRLRSSDLMLTSVHPLGTCRMGKDRKTSVVDIHHEAHEVSNLFIVDGSALPATPRVNPQLTIMALAHRAAESIGERLI